MIFVFAMDYWRRYELRWGIVLRAMRECRSGSVRWLCNVAKQLARRMSRACNLMSVPGSSPSSSPMVKRAQQVNGAQVRSGVGLGARRLKAGLSRFCFVTAPTAKPTACCHGSQPKPASGPVRWAPEYSCPNSSVVQPDSARHSIRT